MIVYIDTSAILRHLFGQQNAYRPWGSWKEACTSELSLVEGLRTIDRLRLQGKLTDPEVAAKIEGLRLMLDGLGQISVSRSVLARAAEPHPTLIATLDAIHLASATLWQRELQKEIHFLTHDAQLGTAAKALGFATLGI